jgi:hypothetical protein
VGLAYRFGFGLTSLPLFRAGLAIGAMGSIPMVITAGIGD